MNTRSAGSRYERRCANWKRKVCWYSGLAKERWSPASLLQEINEVIDLRAKIEPDLLTKAIPLLQF